MGEGTLIAVIVEKCVTVKHRLVSIFVLTLAIMAAQPAWAVPRSAGSVHLSPYVGMAWFVAGFELGPWEQYLVNEITPDLERLSVRELPRVSWLHFDETIILPDFALPLMQAEGRPPLRLSFRQSRLNLMLSESLSENIRRADRFQQSIMMPGLTHRVTDNSDLTVSAVLASQRFGVAAMNLQTASTRVGATNRFDALYLDPAQTEISHGTGLRFALSSELLNGVRLEAAFQSRINMDEFATVRGVHGTSAELDIPPRFQVGLELHTTSRSWLNFGVSQIFYSDVGAFPSHSLPARFTALLGDRNSPDFAWDDLTVYRVGWRWQAADDVEFFVDYRTRTQPRPTAPALAAALGSEMASNSIIAGLSRNVGKRSRLHLNAAYAPPEYAFGGNLFGVVSDELDQDFEVQAMLSLDF